VADGLSRQYVGKEVRAGNGHEWTVSKDWEARTGLTHDIFAVGEVAETTEAATMRAQFQDEQIFLEVVEALLEALLELDHGKILCERTRACHWATGYMIEDEKLWRVECITKKEAKEMAWNTHRNNGHFGRDMIKIQLMSRICSPGLDRSIMEAMTGCSRCKSFGAVHIHSLLEPITRRHPFELQVCDTLSMSPGKGGFKKLGLYMDVYSQHLSVRKLKTAATGLTMRTGLEQIHTKFPPSETLMCDGGPEFDNTVVRAYCESKSTNLQIVPAYSPWVNGLLEGMNSKLLGRLKRMTTRPCRPQTCRKIGPTIWTKPLSI
jgi:hypothetical protein